MAASSTELIKERGLSLFEIERDLAVLMDARAEADCEDGIKACDQALAEYAAREVAKVDGIRAYLRHCEVMEEAATAEADIQRARAKAWGSRAEALEKACLLALEAAGKKSVEGRTGKLSVRNNGGKQPLVIDDESKLPSVYTPMIITNPVDREAVRRDLENGIPVPGAHLGERGKHLSIT